MRNTAHMQKSPKDHTKEKSGLHPRNVHRQRYDFKQLVWSCPGLAPFVARNAYNDESVDFFDPVAVLMLNRALLKYFYHVDHWDIPPEYLCPPIPGRADYIHYVADILGSKNGGIIPTGKKLTCLDVGVGASCVYPIIGIKEYGWSFIGSDIDPVSLKSAEMIVRMNPRLKGNVELRLQQNRRDTFRGILKKGERVDLTVCNPPFHASRAEARAGSARKVSHLKGRRIAKPVLNFGGQNDELWCEGGEARFIRDMVVQSKDFGDACFWFSTLVSKQSHLRGVYQALTKAEAAEVRTIPMSQGSKQGRLVAWTFLGEAQQKHWRARRWQ